jgi:hypothetical protein
MANKMARGAKQRLSSCRNVACALPGASDELEGEKGRALSWEEAGAEWTEAHRKEYEKFLLDTLLFPNLVPAAEQTRQDSGASELARRSANDMRLVRHRPSHRPE